MPSGFKEGGIRKFEFVPKTQFLSDTVPLVDLNQLFLIRECPILERIPLLSSSSILLDRSWFKPDLELKFIYRVFPIIIYRMYHII